MPGGGTGDRKETHCKVLMQLQSIFGHLLEGKVQFYIPKGFWKDFRYSRINLNFISLSLSLSLSLSGLKGSRLISESSTMPLSSSILLLTASMKD